MKYLILFVTITLVCLSCTDAPKKSNYKFEKVEESDIVFDIVFPKSFWEHIHRESPPTIKRDVSVYDLFEALPIDIKLIEDKGSVLKGVNSLITLNQFGGKIDYAQYVSGEANGSFRVEFDLTLEEEQTLKVYFLSWSDQFEQGDEIVGNGCLKIYDLTSYFEKTVFKDGLLLHTSQQRYLNLTAGRFYFISYMKNKIRLAQITFTDQRFESQLCKNKI